MDNGFESTIKLSVLAGMKDAHAELVKKNIITYNRLVPGKFFKIRFCATDNYCIENIRKLSCQP